jgi:hypothetical protein
MPELGAVPGANPHQRQPTPAPALPIGGNVLGNRPGQRQSAPINARRPKFVRFQRRSALLSGRMPLRSKRSRVPAPVHGHPAPGPLRKSLPRSLLESVGISVSASACSVVSLVVPSRRTPSRSFSASRCCSTRNSTDGDPDEPYRTGEASDGIGHPVGGRSLLRAQWPRVPGCGPRCGVSAPRPIPAEALPESPVAWVRALGRAVMNSLLRYLGPVLGARGGAGPPTAWPTRGTRGSGRLGSEEPCLLRKVLRDPVLDSLHDLRCGQVYRGGESA